MADSSRLPDLVRGLKSPSAATRARVAAGLGSLGAAAKPAVPDLIAALKDRDVPVRAAAAYALGQIGPEAREAAPALKELAKRPATREVATKALGLIGR